MSAEGDSPRPPIQEAERRSADSSPATTTATQDLPIYAITVRQLRQLRWLVRGLLVLSILLVLALGVTLPRSMAYGDLMQENLALRERLTRIDRKMTEVDRVLRRLRLYDAQLESLDNAEGDHGPLSGDDFTDFGATPPSEPPSHPGVTTTEHVSGLRPAEMWADAVQSRLDTFLALASLAEPDVARVVRELEDLHALEEALPSSWPAEGSMTSRYGWRRSPFGRTWRFHSGVDIDGRRGDPIHAAAPGRVLKAGYNSGYGRMVEIDHGFGISTLYAHCTRVYVREGQQLAEGELLGTVGSTGRSTGPHLHFEVRLDGHPVDPLDYLPR